MSGKRANIFSQGRPERPYDERDEDDVDPPRQATAAQLATRKIKTAKPRRGAAGASTPSQSANFGAPSSFHFGASAPAVGGNGPMFGASSNAFGSGATNSFPPAQSTAPSNAFAASSFPAFGATGQSTGFNPQPPTTADFNFTGSSATHFAANNTPAMNGNSTPSAFGGGSAFSSQAPTNPFGGLSQTNVSSGASTGGLYGISSAAPSNNMFSISSAAPSNHMFSTASGAPSTNLFSTSSVAPSSNMFSTSSVAPSSNMFSNSSAAPSNNMFSTSSAAPSNNMFSTTSGAPSTNMFGTSNANATSTPASFSFSGVSSSVQPSSTPALSNTFGGFGGAQNNAAPAQNNLFSNFGPNTQNGSATQQQAPQNSLSNAGTSAQGTQSTTATAPSSNLFGFGAMQPNVSASSAAPRSNMFATAGTLSSASAANPFAQLPTAAASSAPSFTSGQQTPQAQEKASSNPFGAIKLPKDAAATPKPALSSSSNASEQPTAAPSETPKPNLFASLAKPTPAANSPGFGIFGAAQKKAPNSEVSNKSTAAVADKAPDAAKPNFLSGFSTPQPAKTADAEKTKAGMFTAQAKPTGNGVFAQTFQSENSNAGNAFKSAPKFPAFKPQTTTSSAESPKETATHPTPAKDASNPFSSLPAPSQRPNLFAPQKEQASTPSSSSMPTLTSSATSSSEATSAPELPKIPKAHVPKEWNASMAPTSHSEETDSLFKVITNLTVQLQQLNERYRSKLSTLSPSADWSSLSLWHHQHSSAIKTKIDVAKKQRAAEKGITGNESALSTKRKVNHESPENRDASPTKRARPTETPATPTPKSTNPPPKPNPPATATSNLFAKAINNKSSAPVEQSNVTAAKTTDTPTPASTLAQVPGFQPFSGVATPISLGGFQFNGGSASSQAPSSSGPAFKPVTSSGSGGFASQFAATAKTFEQLAAERKKKAMDADYDSDEETKEEWSARYDKQEAERMAKEKAAAAAAPAFSLPALGKTPDASTSSRQAKPASGASTPAGLFGSRPASPALSTTGSVFDAPSTAQTPSSNIFGHLSSGSSSNNQGESEDDGEQATHASKNNPTTPPKRKFGASADEATESHDEEDKRQKQSTSSKVSLFSRMTRSAEDGSESEKENNSKTNGTYTPTNKPFAFFDFNAAAGPNSAPAKSDAFAGDQTFKPGTPIKFGDVAATEKKAPPTFQFQAPSSSTTPSKPPPSNIFGSSLLAANSGLSGVGSAPSSGFSSRAATPLSEAEGSAVSATEDDDEGGKQEQVDLSKLTSEEVAANDVVFETEQALAKHQVDQGDGTKAWENFARGPLYILKDKVTGKCFVRIRIPSGQTPLNYSILPALKSQVTGSSGKMVQATMPKKEGGFAQFFISLKTKELAKEFSDKYNASLPS